MPAWTVSLEDLAFGPGTAYQLATAPAGLGLPEVRSSDQARPQDHGLFWGSDFLGGRTVVLDLALLGANPEGAASLMDELAARWQPPEGPSAVKELRLELPGQDVRVLYGRPRRLAFDTANLRAGVVRATVEFAAADPRFYEPLDTIGLTGLPVVSGGRTYPRTYDLAFGALGTTGTVLAVNPGNYPSRPVATVTGPATNPRLENVTTGEALAFTYTLGAGAFLVIDFDARTVLEGGTSSRYYTVTAGSEWWELAPGLNEIRFRADAYEADARLELRYRGSWL